MRNPGTEPLQITTNDVVELHKMLYAEREAHAVEVAGMRAALDNIALEAKAIEAGYLPEDLTAAIDSAESALAADPGPLVVAVEGVVKALEKRCECFCGSGYKCIRCEALAAYRAALKGGKV